jgi:hypothetical protein
MAIKMKIKLKKNCPKMAYKMDIYGGVNKLVEYIV